MKIEMVRLFDIYSALLSERQREVLNLCYNEDQSLGEISENIGITRQGVRDCIAKAESQLEQYESALGLAVRFSEIKASLADVLDSMERSGVDAELTGKIEKLLEKIV